MDTADTAKETTDNIPGTGAAEQGAARDEDICSSALPPDTAKTLASASTVSKGVTDETGSIADSVSGNAAGSVSGDISGEASGEVSGSEAGKGVVNGCSGGMDRLARWWSRVFFSVPGKGKKLAFTGCCDEHDLFYEQGGCPCDRAFADRILRTCITANLKKRKRPLLVRLHVPLFFWCAVRVCGWYFWSSADSSCSSLPPGTQDGVANSGISAHSDNSTVKPAGLSDKG